MNHFFTSFPKQKTANKTKRWYKECVDAVDISGIFQDNTLRTSYKNKIINVNLYNGVLDHDDLEKTVNPTDINSKAINKEVRHYPIVNPRINLLVGEESKRRFEPKPVVTNRNAISEKEKEKNDFVKKQVIKLLKENNEEDDLRRKLKNLQKKVTSFQSRREKMAANLINHFSKEQDFNKIFNDNFFNSILQGEEYYEAALIGKKPVLKKLNPRNVFWIRSGTSSKIEDSDLIIINDYWSPGQVIDSYYDDLKDGDVKKLEQNMSSTGKTDDPFINRRPEVFMVEDVEKYIDTGVQNGFQLNEAKDAEGNVRVLRVYWRGWTRVKILSYFDKFGNEQEDFVPSSYQEKEDEGEHSRFVWINEWQQGIKIGDDIYIKMGPKDLQFRDLSNPSICHPCITGGTFAVSDTQPVSLMSRVKNYLYLYDVVHERLNELLAANHGKILEMDFATIPKNWSVEKWFHYLKKMKIAVRDSFKEGNKGQATGKLAGSMNNASKGYIDLDQGQNIQQHIGYLEFLKQEMSEIIGVSDQRLGQISSRETARGIERSVTQSSHITEWYFYTHEKYKLDAVKVFLEVAKIAYKGIKEKLQNVLSDGSIEVIEIDGEILQETDYGIVLSNNTEQEEQELKRLAEIALNAGNIEFKDVANMYFSNSISEMKNNLEQSTEEAKEQQQRNFKEEQKTQREKNKSDNDLENRKLDIEDIKNIRDNKTKLLVENSNTDKEKLEIEREKLDKDIEKFYADLEQRKKEFRKQLKND